jgi:hypothetical protein
MAKAKWRRHHSEREKEGGENGVAGKGEGRSVCNGKGNMRHGSSESEGEVKPIKRRNDEASPYHL